MNGTNSGEKRIVSFFIWDPELEHKIDREVKMIDGISKLLNVATTSEQVIECQKAFVLSQQRMLAFMAEIQRKKQNLLARDSTTPEPTKATIILSDIRLPLAWTKIKAKTEQKKFAVFCLARIGCEIIDTQMKSIDKQSSEILFTDRLTFDNVPHNFQLHLEVYALNKSLTVSSSAKDFANRYSDFSANGSPKTTRKALASAKTTNKSAAEEQEAKFALIARTTLNKESVYKMAKVRYLTMENPQENPLMRLPIESAFIARLIALPVCYTRLATFVGIVEVYHVPYTCTLTGGFLHGEEIMRDDYSDQHRFSIPITSDTVVLSRNDQLAFSIYNRGFDQDEFFVQDEFTLINWIRALQQHIFDIRAWQGIYEHIPPARRLSHQQASFMDNKSSPKKSILRTKARSLDNIHQRSMDPLPHVNHEQVQRSHSHYTVDRLSTNDDNDDDDDDEDSVLYTKL